MDFDRDQLTTDLEQQEGFESLLYDDATGHRISKGSTIQGNPTVGIGWNVAGRALSRDRARIILGWWIDDDSAAMDQALPWVAGLSDARQRAMMDLLFNMGMPELLKFNTFLGLMKAGNFSGAADDLGKTPWAGEIGADRLNAILDQIRNG